jgi:hypothetical protein
LKHSNDNTETIGQAAGRLLQRLDAKEVGRSANGREYAPAYARGGASRNLICLAAQNDNSLKSSYEPAEMIGRLERAFSDKRS